jgi:hypothetical protein
VYGTTRPSLTAGTSGDLLPWRPDGHRRTPRQSLTALRAAIRVDYLTRRSGYAWHRGCLGRAHSRMSVGYVRLITYRLYAGWLSLPHSGNRCPNLVIGNSPQQRLNDVDVLGHGHLDRNWAWLGPGNAAHRRLLPNRLELDTAVYAAKRSGRGYRTTAWPSRRSGGFSSGFRDPSSHWLVAQRGQPVPTRSCG